MFLRLCRQVWFITLIVFTIGYASVSVAANKTMHLDIQQQPINLNTDDHMHKHALSTAEFAKSQHCQQMMNQSLSAIQDQEKVLHVPNIEQKQHQHCFDCNLMACQPLSVWLTPNMSELSPFLMSDHQQKFSNAYQAQYFSGYWQRILRPPKA